MSRWLRLGFFIALMSLTGCVSSPDAKRQQTDEGDRYMQRGVQAFDESDYPTAAALFAKALGHYQGLDNRPAIVRAHVNLAETSLAIGNLQAAQGHLQQAGFVAGSEGLDNVQPRIGLLRAQLEMRRGHLAAARELLDGLLPTFDERNRPETKPNRGQLSAIATRVQWAFASGDPEAGAWVERYAHSLQRRGTDDPRLWARLHRFQARRALDASALDEAGRLYAQALEAYKRVGYRPGIAATLREMAALSLRQAEWPRAEDQLRRALAVQLWMLDRTGTREVLEGLRRVSEAQGDAARARLLDAWIAALSDARFSDWQRLKGELAPF